MKRNQSDQITIAEYMGIVKEQHWLSIHGGECFRCLYFESHRCRNNWHKPCPDNMHFEEYTGSTVKQCMLATIEVFQDGYIHCPIIDCYGCQYCMDRLRADKTLFQPDPSQNYERKPRWATT